LYKKRCQDANIPVNHYAIPPKIAQAQEEGKMEKSQAKLNNMLVDHPEAFTKEGTLHAMAQFVACDDQVSRLLNNNKQYLQAKLKGFCYCK